MSEIEQIDFQHPSEKEFAKLLDFYGIQWKYEPRTFPLEYNEDGSVKSAFSPDFYLVEQDLYVELTTQSPRLNAQKNKKIKKLRALYPHINIKLLNRRDIRSLAIKYDFPDPTDVNYQEGHPRDHS